MKIVSAKKRTWNKSIFLIVEKIEVITVKDEKKHHAVMNEPSRELFERRIPKVKVTIDDDRNSSFWYKHLYLGI